MDSFFIKDYFCKFRSDFHISNTPPVAGVIGRCVCGGSELPITPLTRDGQRCMLQSRTYSKVENKSYCWIMSLLDRTFLYSFLHNSLEFCYFKKVEYNF